MSTRRGRRRCLDAGDGGGNEELVIRTDEESMHRGECCRCGGRRGWECVGRRRSTGHVRPAADIHTEQRYAIGDAPATLCGWTG
jgi:hypothetical protein